MTAEIYDLVILGGGPAGLTAAIYTSRAKIKTLVFSGNPSGGQLITTTDVENFPGFPDGILGPQLIQNFKKQAERFGTEFVERNAVKIVKTEDNQFDLTDESNKSFKAKSIIIATGASAKWLELESEQRLRGKGVSACATCDGFFFKDKVVAVVGGGDAAMEEALFLTKFCPTVYLLVRGDRSTMKASKYMQQRLFDNKQIIAHFNVQVKEVLGEMSVNGLRITNLKTQAEETLEVEGLFVAIGHKPNTQFLEGFVELDHMGYVKVTDNTKSSVEGVFVGGDVSDFKYRQAVTAAGLGCMAALDTEKYLSKNYD